MASSDKNLEELKSLVVHTLETNGVLGQIRAQLRANVYKAIDNDDDGMCVSGSALLHKAAGGQLMAEIVADFLEHYGLRHSLSVFLPEAALAGERRSREKVASDAGVPEAARESPLLARLLEVVSGAGGRQGGVSHHVAAGSPKSLTKPAPSVATTRASTADVRVARADGDLSLGPDAQDGVGRRRKLSSLSGSDKDHVEDTASKRLLQLDQHTSLAKVGSDVSEVSGKVEEAGESGLKLRDLAAPSLSRSAGSSPASSPVQSAASSPVASARGASGHHRPAADVHDDANSSVHSAGDSVSIEGSSQSDDAHLSANQHGGHRGSSGSHGAGGLDRAGGLDEDSIHEDVSDYGESHEVYEESEPPLSDSGDKF